MLPGQKFSPDDLIVLARRRVWFILLPAAMTAAAGAVWIHRMPDRYRATATVMVVPQVVPERMVGRTVSQRVGERVDGMKEKVLSRTQLEALIKQFNLYPSPTRAQDMDSITERMRARDLVFSVKTDTFDVSFVSSSPRSAKQVADAVATKFIDQSVLDKAYLADSATRYFDAQLEDVRKKLEEQEKQFTDYQLRFAGQLPAQEGANMANLNATRQAIRQNHDAIAQAEQRRINAESQLNLLENQMPEATVAAAPAGAAGGRGPLSTWDELQLARKELANQERLRGAIHPEVGVARRNVQMWQERYDREMKERPVSAEATPTSPAEAIRQKGIKDNTAILKQVEKEIADRKAEIAMLEARELDLAAKVAAVPIRQSEMVGLNRNYDQTRKTYEDLLGRRAQAQLAANLDRQELGEQFRLVNPASTPATPISPNRPALTMMSVAVGVALGVALVVLIEYRDRTFKTDDEVARLLEIPVLAVVPFMQTEEEKRRTLFRRLAMHAGLGAAVLACFAVVVYTLR